MPHDATYYSMWHNRYANDQDTHLYESLVVNIYYLLLADLEATSAPIESLRLLHSGHT